MLILTRKIDEAIRLGEDIRIVLVQIKGGQVRLGIECPPHVRVLREELYEAVRQENLKALSTDPIQIQALSEGKKKLSKQSESTE
ncbi:MAG: carbon storage regulator CsrA [Nitrospirota bacterium]|nr:carbon storage regulator CsrA [Nitrospirota bacterium]MDH4362254.1 carbon storage regulator CsrA [Nitrospirota bacterium]